jgi:hypothetical protein
MDIPPNRGTPASLFNWRKLNLEKKNIWNPDN